jgi:hypothetical protein
VTQSECNATVLLLLASKRSCGAFEAAKATLVARRREEVFQPGQSGNPKGRRPKRLFDDRLREALASKRGDKAKMLVDRLIAKASTGNVAALKLVCERVGGKPKPAEQIAAGGNEAVTLEQVRQQLAALLAQPEVRRSLQNMLGSSNSEVVQ